MRKMVLLMVVSLLFTVKETIAVERTGEILRELLLGLERDFETLENETKGSAQRRETLTKQLEEKWKAYNREQNPIKRKTLEADLRVLLPQLNKLDKKDVDVALKTIGEVILKLKRMGTILQRSGALPPEEELLLIRQKLGTYLTTTANLLEAWEKKASPAMKGEIVGLKGILVGVLQNWEAPATHIGIAHDELARTVRALERTHSKLLMVKKEAEKEGEILLIGTYADIADLALIRLNEGKINLGSDIVDDKWKAIIRRREILIEMERETSLSNEKGGPATLGPETEGTFERITRGEFKW